MKSVSFHFFSIIVFLLTACSTTIEPTITPEPTQNPLAESFPMTELGPYKVGKKQDLVYIDSSRDNREINITVWYPSLPNKTNPDQKLIIDGEPNTDEAPYPMMLSSTKVANIFATHLVSYGFTWVSVDDIDSSDAWDKWIIDQPLDLLFALNTVSENQIEGLEKVIDTNNVGSMGYSFDAFNTLTLSGARIDPEAYKQNCENATNMENPPEEWWINYCCFLYEDWDIFVDWVGPAITSNVDGLWQPITDNRIKAFMPMAPEGAWLFNERGLAVVNRPILIIGAEKDTINYYDLEATFIFENLGSPEKYFITFLDKGHMMIYSTDEIARMKHFASAFFGYYLQRNKDLKYYFSEEFVDQHKEFAWNVYLD